MTLDFKELDFRRTPLGELSLRQRMSPSLGITLYEVKLGDEFLMSSLFTEGEIALANLGLAALGTASADIVVGGLGLGYTAQAALAHPAARSLLVIEALAPVIEWHRRGLVPLGAELSADPRCEYLNGDFFALAASPGLDPRAQTRRFDAILLDIDHSPRHVLNPAHAALYTPAGLQRLASHLNAGGVFALWSNDPPDAEFLASLRGVFAVCDAHRVRFHNPLQGGEAANTVYVSKAR